MIAVVRRTCDVCGDTFTRSLHDTRTPHGRECSGCLESVEQTCSACYLHSEHEGWRPTEETAQLSLFEVAS